MTHKPSICLNMIVRNEAHVIGELFDTVAPYLDKWVIVDTGSDDGTQDVIRNHMAELGIPGELHERPWRHFGHNRSEALELAQGHSDYIWVMDADDLLLGTLDLSQLHADRIDMHIESPGVSYWRAQIFRDGVPFRYDGVVHEVAVCDLPHSSQRLEGDYLIQSRRLGGRNQDQQQKYRRDAELLMAEVERNPDDARSVFYVARSYNCLYDWPNARLWYARRAEMGGWDEEVFYSLWRVATAMDILQEPWPQVLEAYLRAWEYRPIRAEPLHDLAVSCRNKGHYALGHLFAVRAAAIPMPDDALFVNREVYRFRALDEQAVNASWLGRSEESFALVRQLMQTPDIPEIERTRIAANWRFLANIVSEPAKEYPRELVASLTTGPSDSEVTVTVSAGPDVAVTERTVNSFLNCCTDLTAVGRFLIVDNALTEADRLRLAELYPFAEITPRCSAEPSQIRAQVGGRFWLHLGEGWQFFAPDRYISRLTQVLEAEPGVFAVGINFDDARTFNDFVGDEAPPEVEQIDWETRQYRMDVPVGAKTEHYVLTDTEATGPVMFDTARADRHRAGEPFRTATLDEVFCITEL